MPSTTLNRDELLDEYVVRAAISLVGNRIASHLAYEDEDIYRRLPAGRSDSLIEDARLDELFDVLFPREDTDWGPADWTASADSCALAAQILRSVVYHAEDLRGEAERLFALAVNHRAAADA